MERTMFLTADYHQIDRRRMKEFIASRLPDEGCDVVLADGPDGEVWVSLDPVRYHDGGLDLHWESNCREAVGVRELYERLRLEDTTAWEWGRELKGEIASRTVQSLEEI